MGINDNRVLSNWMRNVLRNEDIIVYGDGKQTRTFCYVEDGIAMCFGVLIKGKNGEIYNVGNPAPELSMTELAKIFCDTLNYKDITKRVIKFVEESQFQLIETLAENIANIIKSEFGVERVKLRVSKPGALRFSDDVGIIIER